VRALQAPSGHVAIVADSNTAAASLLQLVLPSIEALRTIRVAADVSDTSEVLRELAASAEPAADAAATLDVRSALDGLLADADAASRPVFVIVERADEVDGAQLERLRRAIEFRPDAIARMRMVLLGGRRLAATIEDPSVAALASRLCARVVVSPANHVAPPAQATADSTGDQAGNRATGAPATRRTRARQARRNAVMVTAGGAALAFLLLPLLPGGLQVTGHTAIAPAHDRQVERDSRSRTNLEESADSSAELVRMAALTLVANDGIPTAARVADNPPRHARPALASPPARAGRMNDPLASDLTVVADASSARGIVPNVPPVPKLIVRQPAGQRAAETAQEAPVREPAPEAAASAVAGELATTSSAAGHARLHASAKTVAPAAPTEGAGAAAAPTPSEQERFERSATMPTRVAAATRPVKTTQTDEPQPMGFALQVASFGVQANAEALQKELATTYRSVVVDPIARGGKTFHRVRIENLASLEELHTAETALRAAGYTPVRCDSGAGR